MELWFSSDHHLSHTNSWQKFKNPDGTPMRPFHSDDEMNERMVEEHNKRVKPSDHWYCLGDISMRQPGQVDKWLRAMNGHKRLIRGNHDIFRTKDYLKYFDEIYAVRYFDGILFTHYPIHPVSIGRYRAIVHGHIHEGPNLPPVVHENPQTLEVFICPYLNITVEHTDYKPLSLDEIKVKVKEMVSESCQK